MIAVTEAAAREALHGLVDAGESVEADLLVEGFARACWSVLTEPGDRVAGELVGALGAAPALAHVLTGAHAADAGEAADPGELAPGLARWRPRVGEIPAAFARARRNAVHLVWPGHRHWPRRADDLGPFAPLCLWLRGDAGLLSTPAPAVALVGARAATAYGEHVATEFAAECAAAGIVVWSGAAYGIDGAAHRGALQAHGSTVAVMAGGVERAYPAGHFDLVERIAREGLVIAEVACGTAPTKHRFLSRNRLIAALSDATVVVEAGWRSGSRNTAHHAQAIGRPLGVVPGPITSASSMGCHRLLRDGDAVCITSGADLRELVGLAAEGSAADEASAYLGERVRILDALTARGPRTAEDVARRAGISLADAAALLGLCELEGLVARGARGWVRTDGRATLW